MDQTTPPSPISPTRNPRSLSNPIPPNNPPGLNHNTLHNHRLLQRRRRSNPLHRTYLKHVPPRPLTTRNPLPPLRHSSKPRRLDNALLALRVLVFHPPTRKRATPPCIRHQHLDRFIRPSPQRRNENNPPLQPLLPSFRRRRREAGPSSHDRHERCFCNHRAAG